MVSRGGGACLPCIHRRCTLLKYSRDFALQGEKSLTHPASSACEYRPLQILADVGGHPLLQADQALGKIF